METDKQSINRILERIQALLAMGNDKSSPKEATIALKRARALMDKHQLQEPDLDVFLKESKFNTRGYSSGKPKEEIWVSTLAYAVAKMNDCVVKATLEPSVELVAGEYTYQFSGYAEDVELSRFMLSYLMHACVRAYETDRKSHEFMTLDDKRDYLESMSLGISRRIELLISEREIEAMLKEKSGHISSRKKQTVQDKFGETRFNNVSSSTAVGSVANKEAIHAGYKASKDVFIGAFITPNNNDNRLAKDNL